MSLNPKTPAVQRTGAERTRAYRARLRGQGLKPRTIWTYDVDDPAFRERLNADLLKARNDPGEREIISWLEAVQVEDGLWD